MKIGRTQISRILHEFGAAISRNGLYRFNFFMKRNSLLNAANEIFETEQPKYNLSPFLMPNTFPTGKANYGRDDYNRLGDSAVEQSVLAQKSISRRDHQSRASHSERLGKRHAPFRHQSRRERPHLHARRFPWHFRPQPASHRGRSHPLARFR